MHRRVVLVVGLLVTVLNARSVVAPLASVRLGAARGRARRPRPAGRGLRRHRARRAAGRLQPHGRGAARARAPARRLRAPRRPRGRPRPPAAARCGWAGRPARSACSSSTSSAPRRWRPSATRPRWSPCSTTFFEVVVDEVDRAGGLVNKFMGDAVLAVFGAPVDQPGHAGAALAAARRIRRAAARRAARRGGRHRRVHRPERGRQRRHPQPPRVHRHRRRGQRRRPAHRARQDRASAGAADTRETVLAAHAAGADDEAARWEGAGSTVLRGRPSATDLVRPRASGTRAAPGRAPDRA